MGRLLTKLLVVAAVLMPGPVLAWGPEGHEVVAHIAAMNLTPHARESVAALLGGDAEAMMAIDANWADEIRDARPETSTWHYVNLEVDSDLHFDPVRDCPAGNCAVAQILRDETVLQSAAPPAQKAEALKFLIHFVGDIHQPLHAGEDHDNGGNTVSIRYRGVRKTGLHHFWDTELVTGLGKDPVTVARGIDSALGPAQKAAMMGGTPQSWAEDSAAVAKRVIYAQLGSAHIPVLQDREVRTDAGVARLQLAKAGYALAGVLNRVFK